VSRYTLFTHAVLRQRTALHVSQTVLHDDAATAQLCTVYHDRMQFGSGDIESVRLLIGPWVRTGDL
jgi:hypothetical protein